MRISLDILNRRVDLAAPLILGETALPVTIVRKDDDAFADSGSGAYRLAIAFRDTLIAACALTESADFKTLTGTLSTNTAEAQQIFASMGYTPEIEVTVAVRLMDSDGDLVKNLALSTATMTCTADDGGDVTNVTVSQSGAAAIDAGATYIDITFDTAFATAPSVVLPTIKKPTADADDVGAISISSITTSGFRASFTAAPPISGYYLMYYARV